MGMAVEGEQVSLQSPGGGWAGWRILLVLAVLVCGLALSYPVFHCVVVARELNPADVMVEIPSGNGGPIRLVGHGMEDEWYEVEFVTANGDSLTEARTVLGYLESEIPAGVDEVMFSVIDPRMRWVGWNGIIPVISCGSFSGFSVHKLPDGGWSWPN